mgnify:CR=1 FL=1
MLVARSGIDWSGISLVTFFFFVSFLLLVAAGQCFAPLCGVIILEAPLTERVCRVRKD